jgi:A/G-specific adenine glycosylase
MDDRRALLRWYRTRDAAYPWRRGPVDAYRVLVSEVMLQQTQAARVAPAFQRFLQRFPTIRALASAPRAQVIRSWAGLGYNRRAVSLHEAAKTIVREHDGIVPLEVTALEALPGVGPYTAAAVSSIGHGVPVPAVDTNVRRVVSRHRLGLEPTLVSPREVEGAAGAWMDRRDPGRWNQAVMDLGREVCRPVPRCTTCPVFTGCRFRSDGPVPVGAAGRRPQPAFRGSSRELRGTIVGLVRERRAPTLGAIARATGRSVTVVTEAVNGLAADGLVHASDAARRGHATGRISLPRG